MITEIDRENRSVLLPLFSKMDNPMLQSFLQGHVGHGWADSALEPACGRIMVGDMTFPAGLTASLPAG